MPKKNQVKGFASQALAGGRIGYYWKPTPRERREGWSSLTFEAEPREDAAALEARAITSCLARNRDVAAARAGAGARAVPARAPVRPRWRDLVGKYRADQRYLALAPKSRAEYDSRLRTLGAWALDGDLLLADLDRPMVIELRDTLVNHDARRHRTAALLRVLSILLGFGFDKGMLPLGLGASLAIPTPPKRTRRIVRDQIAFLLAGADALGLAHVRLGIVLGFYSMQREGDLLAATGFQIKPVDDVSADARRALAGPDGRVMGLWLQQGKTQVWVAVSLAPVALAEVEAAIAANRARPRAEGAPACTSLILYPGEDRPCPEWRFQRDFRAVVDHAAAAATARQDHDLASLLRGEEGKARDAIQFRDLRRSGMCWMREMRVPAALIASNSGHSIKQTEDILDTYMPRDTRAAAEGMALAVARQAERDAEDAAEREEGR